MNLFKKLTSVVLSGLMLACGISTNNTFATGKKNIDTLVVGNKEAKNKFSRILFGQEEKFGDWYSSQDDEKNNVNFYMSENNDEKTGDLIHNGKGNKLLPNYSFFKVVLAAVDADQELEKVKDDMRNIVNFICDYKKPFTQILIVGCKESDKYIDFCELSNFTCASIESDGYEIGWGTNHDKKFSGTGQFLGFHPLYQSNKSDFVSHILSLGDKYDFYKKKNSKNNLINTICDHPIASGTIGLAGLGAVAGACYGIYKGAEKIYNKITNKSLPKKSVPNINKKA